MSALLPPPLYDGSTTPAAAITQSPPYVNTSSSSSSKSPSTAILVIIIIALAAVVLACIYVLFRYLSDRFHRSFRTFSVADDVPRRDAASNQPQCQVESNSVLRSLPLFRFRSVKGNLTGGDCAVCLSKFEPPDQLRLLPLCCHAFHAECIDTWIASNQTCPLCRSTVLPCDSDALDKILPAHNRSISNNSGSFRVEIGNISSRHDGRAVAEPPHSYSIGSFDYIVNENGYEVSIGSITQRGEISDSTSADKESSIGVPIPEPPGEILSSEIAGGRSWLRDYVDMLTSVSLSSSFRSSGRFFSGSSRSSDPASAEDLEANQAGEEISELFRWLSGI